MARVFTFQLAIMIFVGLILSLEIPLILKILTPEEFWLGGIIAFFAVMSRIILASYYHMFFGLLYSKLTYKISFIQFVITVINVAINLVLIKNYGILGAVIASCLANFVQCIIAYYMSKGYYHIPFEWSRIFKMVLIAAILFMGIDFFSVTKIGFSVWLDSTFGPVFGYIIDFFHLHDFKDGKLLSYAIENISVIADVFIKFCLSFSFLIGLVVIGVIPKAKVVNIFNLKNFGNPTTAILRS
jgi:O-antigen/teichoic acid export membrane protein